MKHVHGEEDVRRGSNPEGELVFGGGEVQHYLGIVRTRTSSLVRQSPDVLDEH